MPQKDETGPEGQGPQTGRGTGTCPTCPQDIFKNPRSNPNDNSGRGVGGPGRGMGPGGGRGRGLGQRRGNR